MFYLGIAIFGAIGVLVRLSMVRVLPSEGFPFGVLAANILGSLLMGWIYSLDEIYFVNFSWLKPALMIGLFGALTTFSSYALDTFRLLDDGQWGMAAINLLSNNILCISFMYIGCRLGKIF